MTVLPVLPGARPAGAEPPAGAGGRPARPDAATNFERALARAAEHERARSAGADDRRRGPRGYNEGDRELEDCCRAGLNWSGAAEVPDPGDTPADPAAPPAAEAEQETGGPAPTIEEIRAAAVSIAAEAIAVALGSPGAGSAAASGAGAAAAQSNLTAAELLAAVRSSAAVTIGAAGSATAQTTAATAAQQPGAGASMPVTATGQALPGAIAEAVLAGQATGTTGTTGGTGTLPQNLATAATAATAATTGTLPATAPDAAGQPGAPAQPIAGRPGTGQEGAGAQGDGRGTPQQGTQPSTLPAGTAGRQTTGEAATTASGSPAPGTGPGTAQAGATTLPAADAAARAKVTGSTLPDATGPSGAERIAAESGRVHVASTLPAPSAQPATGPAAPAAPQQGSPAAPPARQIAAHILPLRLGADGVHRMTVHLHPAELGAVSVVAEIRGGAVALQLVGASDAAYDALRSTLSQLRDELQREGFTSCTLDLRRDAPGEGQQRSEAGSDRRAEDGSEGISGLDPMAEDMDVADLTQSRSDRLLDVRL